MTMKDTFDIPNYRLEDLNSRIEELNRKAVKLGLTPIETRVLAFQPGYRVSRDRWEPSRTTVQVLGARPKLPGYRFVGTLQHLGDSNVVRTVPGEEAPGEYRTRPALCEHCNTVRQRKDSYLVRHEESGKLVQLGRDCVKDFLGGISPQALAGCMELIRELEAFGDGEGGGSGKLFVPVEAVLVLSSAAIRQRGWVSKAMTQNNPALTSTASLVVLNLRPDKDAREHLANHPVDRLVPTDEDEVTARETLSWGKTLVGNREQYLHNLGAILASFDEIELLGRDLGLTASAVSAYLRAQDKLRTLERAPKVESNFVGEVGKRQEFELEFVGSRVVSEGYGFGPELKLLEFRDQAQNLLVWFTGTQASGDFSPGKKYLVKATVKRHQVYREKKQTVLTRCALVKYLEGGRAA